MLLSAHDTPEVVELTDNLAEQHKENVPVPMAITPASLHRSSEDAPAPNGLTSNFNGQSRAFSSLESAQVHPCPIKMQDQKLEQQLNPVSLDNLAFNSQEKASQDLIAMASDEHDAASFISKSTDCLNANSPINNPSSTMASDEHDAASVISKSTDCLNANSPINNPNSTPATDSVEIQKCSNKTRSTSFLSSPTQQNSTKMKTRPSSILFPSNSGERHQMLKGIVPEHDTSGMHLHSKGLQHRCQHPSTSQHNPSGSVGSKMPTTYPQGPLVWKHGNQTIVHCKKCSAGENIAIDNGLPVSNMPVTRSSSTNVSHLFSPQVSCPQPNRLQHGSHSTLQPTNHSQTLSQTWQYQQHLLHQQYQEQLVQMLSQHQQHKQSHHHQEQLQPQQQEHNQQQASSWQHQQFLEQQLLSVSYQVQQLQRQISNLQQAHQQERHRYHQSAQQLQLQHGWQWFPQVPHQQLQLYRQSQKLAYEMHQRGHERHAAQAYQTSFQQSQLYQQGYGQMLQQHQHHQHQYNQILLQQQLHQAPEHQQQENEQLENHQQRVSNRDLSQGISQKFEGQQSSPEGSDSALSQHTLLRSLAQLNTKRQSGQAASSNQQTSQGNSHSYDLDTHESAASSHHGE